MKQITMLYKNIKYGLINLIKWLPVIWRDRDWDYCYIYDLLYFKFSNMEQLFDDCQVNKKRLREIKIAKNLAKRLSAEDYLSKAIKDWSKKYKADFLSRSDNSNIARKRIKKYCEHADFMKQQDKEYLFNLISKRINSWWL